MGYKRYRCGCMTYSEWNNNGPASIKLTCKKHFHGSKGLSESELIEKIRKDHTEVV